ncbi:MAG: glycosyltransferase [Desulfomicrobium escambiense]|nr:glycosyltransferase [Desulfomicrobium escambiense]
MADQGVRVHPPAHRGPEGPRPARACGAWSSCPLAFVRSLGSSRRARPRLVVGVGGYSSGPIVLLASWLRVPTVILEQNARPGLHQPPPGPRPCARPSWPSRRRCPAFQGKGVVLGNPVREEFYAPARPRAARPALDVLVFGGSQGSRFLNDPIIAALPLSGRRPRTASGSTHQTGDDRPGRRPPRLPGRRLRPRPRSAAYLRRHAGLLRPGRPGRLPGRGDDPAPSSSPPARRPLLVPFAGAADDHQTAERPRARRGRRGRGHARSRNGHARGAGRPHPRRLLDRPEALDAMERNVGRAGRSRTRPAGSPRSACHLMDARGQGELA